ncbi:MAG: PKD domain-containing protein [Gammaproteobacteria bacterium]
MNKFLILMLSVLGLGLVYAGSPTLPSNVVSYYPMIITNTQSTATSTNFTQNITFDGLGNNNLLNGNASNVEFFYANGTIIPSWFEGNVSNETQNSSFNTSSNLMWWLNLTNGSNPSIAANSNITIYMGFGAMSANFFNTNNVGEAPQLSSTYAEYDDGANVFNYYQNFNGTALPTGWVAYGTSYTINNGVELGSGTGGISQALIYNATTFNATTTITDTLILQDSISGGIPNAGIELSAVNTHGTSGYDTGYNFGAASAFTTNTELESYSSSGVNTAVTSSAGIPLPSIISAYWNGINSEVYDANYTQLSSTANTAETANTYYISLIDNGGAYQHHTTYQYIRTRAYPPAGVMPSQSYETLQYISNSPTLPANIINYYPINITNTQSIATSSNFTQAIIFNGLDNNTLLNSNASNVEFFYANGTIIPSWFEGNLSNETLSSFNTSSNLMWWLNLTNGSNPSIAANSNITIYMGFGAMSANFFNTNNVGEAPQLSSTYAEYDDGNSIFSYYQNFQGTTIPTGWNISNGTAPSTASIDNGVTITEPAGSGNYTNVYQNSSTLINSTTNVLDIYGSFSTPHINTGFGEPYLATIQTKNGIWINTNTSNNFAFTVYSSFTGYSTNTSLSFSSVPALWSFSANTSAMVLQNNLTTVSINANLTSLNQSIGFDEQSGSNATIFVQYVDTRPIPPNDIMPTISFGAIGVPSVPPPALTISINPINYGQNDTITATANISTDKISIFVNGYNASSATGATTLYLNTTSIWFNGNLSVGSNNITAEESNGNTNTTTLTITQAVPNLTISVPTSFTYNNTNLSISASSQANSTGNLTGLLFLNQLNQNLTLNTILVNSSTASISNVGYIENLTYIQSGVNLSAGTYSYNYSVVGNSNYSSANIYGNFTINQATPILSITNSSNYTYNGTSGFFNVTITTINNQVQGTLWVNSVNTTTTFTNTNYSSNMAAAGTYSGVFNTTGNTNYTAATTLASGENFTIGKATPSAPTLYVNDSTTNTTALINANVTINATGISSINNQLNWNIYYCYETCLSNLTTYPIILSNSQSIATTSNFTQNITFNGLDNNTLLNGNASNVRFFYANGTTIPSWFEGNTSNEMQNSSFNTSTSLRWWLNLTNGSNPSIAANSNITIYMGFGAMSANFFNSTIGEAPQIWCSSGCAANTYGEYDNGGLVFPQYDNFSGTTLGSQWTTILSTGTSATTNDGLILNADADNAGHGFPGVSAIVYWNISNPNGFVAYTMMPSAGPDIGRGLIGISNSTTTLDTGSGNPTGLQNSYFYGEGDHLNGPSISMYQATSTINSLAIYSNVVFPSFMGVGWNNTGNQLSIDTQTGFNQYTDTGTIFSPINYAWLESGAQSVSGQSAYQEFQYFFTAEYPPKGIMPSQSFGILQNNTIDNETLFNSTNINDINNFSSVNPGLYLWSLNTSGNANYTAMQGTDNYVNLTLLSSFINLFYYNITTNGIYPNNSAWNVTPIYDGTNPITLNVSLVSFTNSEVFSHTVVSNINTTINASNSTLTYGNLSAGTYTIYFNASDTLGNHITNSTTFTISKATPLNPILTINGSSTSTNTITNQTVLVNSTTNSYNNQLTWNIWYTYPNGTLSTPAFSSSTASSTSNNFKVVNTPLSTYNFTINTTGNANYTALNTGNVTDNVYQAFINLLYYNLNGTPVTYPNIDFFNITPNYNASNNITLNVSLISATGHEVFSANISKGINTTIDNSNSTLAFGSLSAGSYTIYFNASDPLGNYFTNSTSFTINKATPTASLGSCTNFTYNGSSCTETASISTYNNQLTGSFNLSINKGTFTNLANITSGSTSNTQAAASFYNYTFNITGNTNYTTDNLQASYDIAQAVPNMTLVVPANFVYNNTNLTIWANNTIYETSGTSPNNLAFTLNLSSSTVGNPTANSTFSYNQNGTNLSAGTYYYNFSTTGNNNYTANYINDSFTIQQANPTTSLGSCTNYVYSGSSCTESGTITTINNQVEGLLNLSINSGGFSTICTSATSCSDTEASAGTYAYDWNWTGGTNYTSGALSATYTISQATPTLTLTNSSNFTYDNVTGWANGTISTFDNQLNATLWINNVNISTTTISTNQSTSAGAGTYNIVFNTTGNINYSSATTSASFTISKATPILSITNSSNYTYNGASGFFNVTITTINNQVQGTLWVNSVNTTTTFTNTNYSSNMVAAGTYSGVFNTTGNTNYTSATTLASGENFTIGKATPNIPELLLDGSNTTLNIYNNTIVNVSSTNVSSPNQADLNNQLTWDIYYFYPNGTLNSTPFNISNINASNNFTVTLNGTWEFTINTTGNNNYTALNTPNISIIVTNPTFVVFVQWYNTTSTNVTYPNVPDFNVTGMDNYTGYSSLTLNASLVGFTSDEIYHNASYVNDTNASINLNYGSLAAGTYTIYFNISDNLGDYGTNSTTFKINQSVPNMSLIIPDNYTYNNINDTIYANNTGIYETGTNTPNNLNFNLALNGANVGNPNANSSFPYTQTGSNLAAGTYAYNFSTEGNINYTSAYINSSFIINQATPAPPVLFINGTSLSNTTTITNVTQYINASINGTSINNQLNWSIWYYYPNGALNSTPFNISNINTSNNFTLITLPTGIYNWTINTTGNMNYTAENYTTAQFNGSSDVVTALVHPYGDTQGSTFTAWIYPETLSSSTYGAVIFGYQGWLNDNNNELYYYTNENGNFGAGTLTPNKWQFVAVTITSDVNPTFILYINGNEVGSASKIGTTGSGGCANEAENVIIGHYSGTCGAYTGTIPWNGSISDAQVYNTSLSSSQIAAIYNEGIFGQPLSNQNNILYMPLDNNTIDYSGQGNNGTANNISYSQYNVSDNIQPAFNSLFAFNLNGTPVTYPNIDFWNVTPSYNGNTTVSNITLNVSLISATGHEVFSANVTNSINTTINNFNSTLAFGNLSAGSYTIYFNISDIYGNYFLNASTFTINKATPTASLGSCTNFTYNGSSCTETASISTYNNQLIGNFNLSINNGTWSNLASITSGTTSNTEAAASFYNYTFNITGNTNYTTDNLQASYDIAQAVPYVNLTSNITNNFTYNSTPFNFTGSIVTYLNQLNGTLWINNINTSVTNATTSYLNATGGIYSIVFNTTGNNNYTANTTTLTYEIYKAIPSIPELLINGTNTTDTVLNNSIVPISTTNISSPNQADLNNQLAWDIVYYYPNGTLDNTPFNISNINTSNNFTANMLGTWNFTLNTIGNANYTALDTYNISLIVSAPFINLLYYQLNTPTYPDVAAFNITPVYIGTDAITLNVSLVDFSHSEVFSKVIAPNVNTTINASNSTLTVGSLAAGTYNIYFVANDTAGNSISNSTTFTITKGSPNLTFVNSSGQIPINYTYNNVPQAYYANNTAYETTINSPNNLTVNLYLNNILIGNPVANSSFNYLQNGANLSSGEYSYIMNTSGNENYTSQSINETFNITKAIPTLSLNLPSNFTYNGIGGLLNYSINTINNQSIVYLSYNLTDNYNHIFNFVNVSQTDNSTNYNYTTDSRSGVFDISLFAPATQNYTSASLGNNFSISQAQGNVSLSLNGIFDNTSIFQHTTIPINMSSTESNMSNPNMTLYLNGTIINTSLVNFSSTDETPANPATQNYTAMVTSNNFTNASQTWFLTVNSSRFNVTFTPTYQYVLGNGLNSTNPLIFNLLNYTYDINYTSTYNLSSISVNFGNAGSYQVYSDNNATDNLIFYNNYTSNSILNHTITINLTNIYNDTASFNTTLQTTAYVFPTAPPPIVYLYNIKNATPDNYTYTVISTPIFINATKGTFPIANVTVNFGDGNSTTLSGNPTSMNHIYDTAGNYTVTSTITDMNNMTYSISNTIQVLNYSYATITLLPPDLGYTINQTYVFSFRQGTFAGNSVLINWGDNESSLLPLPNNGQSGTFIAYHNYSMPGLYYLAANVTDADGVGSNVSVLTNPNLNISLFVYPSIISLTPTAPYNGATSTTLTFTFQIPIGSFPLKNLTINWNDGYGNVNSTSSIINLTNVNSSGVISVNVTHTFPFLTNYTLTTQVCDLGNNCYAQAFPIQLSYPLGANQTANNNFENQTNAEANANSPNVQLAQNPAPYIIIFILILTILGGVLIWFLRKRDERK